MPLLPICRIWENSCLDSMLVYSSLNPASLLRNANHFTWIALAVILVLILLTVVVIRAVRRKKQKQK